MNVPPNVLFDAPLELAEPNRVDGASLLVVNRFFTAGFAVRSGVLTVSSGTVCFV